MPIHAEDFAIVIGIDHYAGLPELHAAERDALDVMAWLIDLDGGGVPSDQLVPILGRNFPQSSDPFDMKPLRHDIDRALNSFGLGQRPRVGRRLYFYFAGHGLGSSFDDVALLMANATRNLLNSNLGARAYRSFLRDAAPFDELVIILDCCRELNDRIQPAGPAFTVRVDQGRAPQVQDLAVLAAAYGRRAFEPAQPTADGERRGLLTQALLDGLTGKAADAHGIVTARSLDTYLRRRVPELAGAAHLTQMPEIAYTWPDLQLATTPPQLRPVRIFPPDPPTGDLLLQDGQLQEIGRHRADLGAWDLDLTKGLYLVTHCDSERQQLIVVQPGSEVQDVRFL